MHVDLDCFHPRKLTRRQPSVENLAALSQQEGNIYYAKSLRIRVINWWFVLGSAWMPFIFQVLVVYLACKTVIALMYMDSWFAQLQRLVQVTEQIIVAVDWAGVVPAVALTAVIMLAMSLRRSNIYILDFTTFKPPKEWAVNHEQILAMMKEQNVYDERSMEFMTKILANSATGQETHWPPGILKSLTEGGPMNNSILAAREESETVICGALRDLFQATGLRPRDVDFLVINCSLFSPTPSLCAMVCNHFKMRSDTQTFNLSGQGCSASLLSIDLARNLLQNNPRKIAVVVSTENLTQNLYFGNERALLLQNTLFRVGGAAVALSSRPQDGI